MGNHMVESISLSKIEGLSRKIIKLYKQYNIKDKKVYKQFGNILPVNKRIQIEFSNNYTYIWICVDGFRWVKVYINPVVDGIKSFTSGFTLGKAKSGVSFEVNDIKYTGKEFKKEIENELEKALKNLEIYLESNKKEIYKLVSEIERKNDNGIANKYTVRNNLSRIGLISLSCINI